MFGPAALVLGILGLTGVAAKSAVDSTKYAPQNARFAATMTSSKFNEEEEEKQWSYIKRYGRTMRGVDLHEIKYGYGTKFPLGRDQRDLYYLSIEMGLQGYDSKRWITFVHAFMVN